MKQFGNLHSVECFFEIETCIDSLWVENFVSKFLYELELLDSKAKLNIANVFCTGSILINWKYFNCWILSSKHEKLFQTTLIKCSSLLRYGVYFLKIEQTFVPSTLKLFNLSLSYLAGSVDSVHHIELWTGYYQKCTTEASEWVILPKFYTTGGTAI